MMYTILPTICLLIMGGSMIDTAPQQTTQAVTVTGKVKAAYKFSFTDLKKLKLYDIGDIAIANHNGETKGVAKDLKGVLLRDVLEKSTLDTDNPKLYSEYYFVCKATDNYKVVYSWNELFNTDIGNSTFIVLEKDNQSLEGTEDSILMVSSKDIRTGRRYLKNLESILVGRVE